MGREGKMSHKPGQNNFEQLFEEAPLPYQSLDINGIFLKVNNAWLDKLGYTKEEVIGKWFGDFLAPEYTEHFKENFPKFKAAGKIDHVEFKMVRKDGQIIHVSFNGQIDYDEHGKFIRTHCIFEDITERKKAEKKEKQYFQDLEFLSKTAMEFVELPSDKDIYQYIGEQLKNIVKNSIILVNSFDDTSDTIHVESVIGIGKYIDKVFKILGEHPVGKSFPINDDARIGLTKGRLVKVPGKLHTLTFGEISKTICHALEKLLNIDAIYTIGFTKEEKLFGIVSIITRNGTELKNKSIIEAYINQASVALQRKQAEEYLISSEERLNIIFESAPDAYYINDFEGTFIDGNKAAEELLGYSREELIGKNFVDSGILPMDQVERAFNLLAENINRKATGPDEFTLKRKDGTKVDVEISTHPVKIDGEYRVLGIARNITERKKIEKAMKEGDRLFRLITENMEDEVWLMDMDMNVTFMTQSVERYRGFSLDEMQKMSWTEHLTPESLDIAIEALELALTPENLSQKDKEITGTNDLEFYCKDGSTVWSETTIKLLRNDKGEPVGLLGAAHDITKRKKAEKTMQENEEKFRVVFNEALDGIVLTNAENGIIVDANSEFQRIAGRSINQLRTMHIWDTRPENEIQMTERAFKKIKEEEEYLKIIKTNFLQPSGNIIPAEFKAHKVVIRDKEYILSIVRDITEIIQAEKDIKSSDEKFQNLFEESLDAVYVTDNRGTIIDMNLAGCDMLGYPRDEIVGINAICTYFQKEDRLRLHQELEEKGNIKDFEVVLKKKDGSQIFCLISATSKKDSKGNITSSQGIIHDLTDRIIIEQRYREEFERAEFYNDLMVHDVRNYNQGIMSNLELLNLSEDLSENARRFSRNALNQVIGSSRLINNLQTLSDLKHSKAILDNMDIIPFIDEALDYTKTSFPDKKIIVNFPDENSSAIVKGNSMLLEVFNNILTNAVKFDRNHEVHIEINITEDEEFYRIEFKDHGPGIKDNMKTMVFDRNIRTDDEIWGTGLGLTLVKQIVESHDGDIWVEDRIEGKREGSNFILTLPRGDAPG